MPAKLILSLNNSVLGEFPLDKERIILGRKPENDIQVDNLAVSGQHAAIITILNDSFLEDLESTNGTYVNGKLIAGRLVVDVLQLVLADGDHVAVLQRVLLHQLCVDVGPVGAVQILEEGVIEDT